MVGVTVLFCDPCELAIENHYTKLCGTVQIPYCWNLQSKSAYSRGYELLSKLHAVANYAVNIGLLVAKNAKGPSMRQG